MSYNDYELKEGTVFETCLVRFEPKDLKGSAWALQGIKGA